ncbi:MAG: fused MFS/spermidine synthase [Pseudomonadota bacterium]
MNANPAALNTRRWTIGLPALLFFSGIAALAYEVLWARMLGAMFGVSTFGVIVTVAAFMLGLGGGAVAGVRWPFAAWPPLRVFAVCEAAVALIALLLPALFRGLDPWLTASTAHTSLVFWYTVQGGVALLVLSVPAALLGFGFAAALRVGRDAGVGIGVLYGINTLGGALGALLPLVLLPTLGWQAAVYCAAGLGLVSAGLAAVWSNTTSLIAWAPTPTTRPAWRTLLAYAGVGCAALIVEIAWTRLYGMVLLRTEYVLAILLAVFLSGAALGSLVARRLADHHLRWLPWAAGVAVILSLWCLPWIAQWQASADFGSLAGALMASAAMLLPITLPATLVLGIWLPLLARRHHDQPGVGAWLYGVNAVGSAVGALLAGAVLIPLLGTSATLVMAALLLVICGWAFAPPGRWGFASIALIALAWPVARMPAVAQMQPIAHQGARDVLVRESAYGITHVVEHTDGQRVLLDDLQHMDASSDPAAVSSQRNQVRLPLLLHPQPKTVLLLGVGTGISASATLDWPGLQVTGVELSAGAIEAARAQFAAVNGKVLDRMQVVQDDARRYLRTTTQTYDVIVGDLFHPDLAGRSSLLSLQQFHYARARLAPGGVFCQWLALNQFDAVGLATIQRTFKQVFPEAQWFGEGFRVALVGVRDGRMRATARARTDAATGGEGVWTWWGRYLGPLSPPPGALQDEWSPVIEFSLPRARYRSENLLATTLDGTLQARPEVHVAAAQLGVAAVDFPAFERAYIASDFAYRAWAANLHGRDNEYLYLMRMAYRANPQDRWVGFALADALMTNLPSAAAQGINRDQILQAVLRLRPDHPEALKSWWRSLVNAGKLAEAQGVRERLLSVAPLDRDALLGAAVAPLAVVP